MAPRIGYLLPTRESIMEGRPEAAPLLALAERAEGLGYDSIWVGDSVTARPRHDAITLLGAVAGRTRRVELGTAVLLPALRNPVLLAHQIATLDQVSDGRVILGVGIASDVPNIRAEFEACGVPWEKRLGRMMEGLRLCRALWSGEPVTWDGRWKMQDATIGPTPYRKGGPPIWAAGSSPAAIERVGKHFDGWFPNGPSPTQYSETLTSMKQAAVGTGRGSGSVTGAAYLTLVIDDDQARAESRMNEFLLGYYNQPADLMRRRQACFAGSLAGAREWLGAFAGAGATHFCLRFAGEHERQLELLAGVGSSLV